MQARWLTVGLRAAAVVAAAVVFGVAFFHLDRSGRPDDSDAARPGRGSPTVAGNVRQSTGSSGTTFPKNPAERGWETAPYGGRNARITLKHLDLSRPPNERELRMAGQLGGPLSPTGPAEPSAIADPKARRRQEADNLSFGRAMNLWNQHKYGEAFSAFQSHRLRFPQSPWAGECELHMGCQAQFAGRWDEAAFHFDWVLNNTQTGTDMNQKGRLRKAVLLMERGNLKGASQEFATMLKTEKDWGRRTYAQYWIRQLSVLKRFQASIRTCGNSAVAAVLEMRGRKTDAERLRTRSANGDHGYTLKELCEVAGEEGLNPTAVSVQNWEPGRLKAPFVAHYRDNHYVVVRREEADGAVVVFDPRLNYDTRLTATDFGHQWSGLAMVFGDRVPDGVRPATDLELEAVGGCCGMPRGIDEECEIDGGCCNGMPEFSVNPITMNLVVRDTPMWHKSVIGPDVEFRFTYKSLDALNQLRPSGNKWMFNYASYLMINSAGQVTIVTPGGNTQVYEPNGSGYTPPIGHADYQLTRDPGNTNRFTVVMGSGTSLIYDVPAGVTNCDSSLLVAIQDPNGHAVTIEHDTNTAAIIAVRDAMTNTFALGYDTNSGLLATISDPWGRVARFAYDSDGNLTNQMDMGGISYGYTYTRKDTKERGPSGYTFYDNDLFMDSMITPKGTTRFLTEPSDGIQSYAVNYDAYPPPGMPMWDNYRITVTQPDGAREEYFYYGGMDLQTDQQGESWYRSPSQMAMAGDPLTLPRTRHRFVSIPGASDRYAISNTVYPDGTSRIQPAYNANRQPLRSVDGMGRAQNYVYNALGSVVAVTNALGHVTTYGYAQNGLDQICMTNALGIREWYRTYDANRRMTSVTDAVGRTTYNAYDAAGLLVAVTNNLGQVTEYVRNADHQVEQVKMGTNVLTSYTYDDVGRMRTQTDATGVTLTYDYDGLDRVTRIAWPDGTYISNVWGCCKIERQVDRIGRITEYGYRYDGQVSWVRDPAGRVSQYVYDLDGNLARLVDPKGNVTTWEYDAMERVTKKIYADNSSLQYAYDAVGNLTNQINARGQSIAYAYDDLNNLIQMKGAGLASVTNRYDAIGRLTNMVDGVGTHYFTYYDDGSPMDVDGPWANDTIHYEYDGLGRQYVRTLNGASVTNFYDALGRIDSQDSPLGHIEFDYLGASALPTVITRPNGLTTTNTYFPAAQDRRLQTIHHTVGANTVSRYDYKYDAAGQITNWVVAQAAAPAPESMALGYDVAGQLVSALVRNASTGTLIRDYNYAYDPAGNRISEARAVAGSPADVVKAMHNNLNQITSRNGGGSASFRGTINEPATVRVGGQPARIRSGNRFEANVTLPDATNDIPVIATDAQGNSRTNVYRLIAGASGSQSFTYDLDGNMLSGVVAEDGISVAMTWDAMNRLLTISKVLSGDTYLTTFTYDGHGRRVGIVEKKNGTTTGDRRFVWNEPHGIVEERNASNGTVKRFFSAGLKTETAQNYFYTDDHLGSIREVINVNGGIDVAYSYDPWGRAATLAGGMASDFRYTKHFLHLQSGLHLAQYRAYSTEIGRWLSFDPIGEHGGLNLYRYVLNDPIRKIDLKGLKATGIKKCRIMDTIPVYGFHRFLMLPSGDTCGGASGIVFNPDPFYGAAVAKGTEIECSSLKLNECKYNIQAFVSCIERHCKKGGYSRVANGGNCISTRNALISKCKKEARKE